MKFAITASPNILGVVGPHHVARNFGNTLCQKFRQQLQKLDFFGKKMQKLAFSIVHFGREGGAPGQKFFSAVIHIG